ncbi:MAG: hypothetical protein CMI60_12380 [Parvibaculum sp.]|jgi:hypothetical protein|nr:hypothetical protein [Parvibaculum sp.]|tara:strand:- start:1556 stop:2242 length:687 start_codon:yes stop_codon:yes gene_type:complete
MCFSAEVSFVAAAVLIPAGVACIYQTSKNNRKFVAFAALPMLLGFQQLFEGFVWVSGEGGYTHWVERMSLAYMFFSWLAWPIWIPISTYFVEPASRKPWFLVPVVLGSMLGALQYFPYLAHDNWLVTRFLDHAISYEGIDLLDFIVPRPFTYTVYLAVIIGPLLFSSDARVRIFGVLVSFVVVITYLFFSYAYVSVFCLGGAIVSLYIVWMFLGGEKDSQVLPKFSKA